MQTAYLVNIFDVQPDPKQPRRLLPAGLRYDMPITQILDTWFDMAQDESRLSEKIQVVPILLGDETDRGSDDENKHKREPGHVEAGFMKLVNLAATIRRDGGLINPVTIYRNDTGLQLETGERRWLAHHLLAYALDEERWLKIMAREVDAPSIWRQAHENTARDDLNAISLARQLALLVMDVYREKGAQFHPYETFAVDRHFYAQVADGNEYPIPRGDREKVIAAMGKSSVTQVNQYRALLRLPDDVWLMADQEDKSEKALRETLQELRQSSPPQAEPDSVSITGVIPHASTQAQESEPDQPDEVEEHVDTPALPEMVEKRLYWAYNRAKSALNEQESYFSAVNADTSPEKLNEMVAQGLLTTRSKIINTNPVAVTYRISAAGAAALGEDPLEYNFSGTLPNHLPPGAHQPAFNGGATRKPVSVGEALGGNKPNPGTPPRRTPKSLLQGADRTMVQTALQATDARIHEIDGVREAISTLERSVDAQKRVLTELYAIRDKLEKD